MACAVVVLRDSARVPTLEELNAFLGEQNLARFKQPERLHVVGTIPRNATGKPMKEALREQLSLGPA